MVRESKHDTILKIGFLNHPEKYHLLDEFKSKFDIVIFNDGSLHPVNYLLREIFNQGIDYKYEDDLIQTKGFKLL